MKLITSIAKLKSALKILKQEHSSIGFVPTMGALHQGHLSLVKASQKETSATVLSVFVNPLQFGPLEDFSRYPRPIENDIELARAAGVELFFYPALQDMYPEPQSLFVAEDTMSKVLCGHYRPGHFQGVCTVVLKLINMLMPDKLFLGQKDAQQLRILQHMTEQFNHPTQVIGCETLRESDGLAMSSRNIYLSDEERKAAPLLFKGLCAAKSLFKKHETNSHVLIEAAKHIISKEPLIKLQYLELRRWKNLEEVSTISDTSVLAIAAHLGKTRLIDNIFMN